MAQQFNYNWNMVSSPYQGVQNVNYFYPPVSPNIGSNNSFYYNNFDMQSYYPVNGSYVGTPSNDNRTFSSGYGSESTSFNSPPVAKLQYGFYLNNSQTNNQQIEQPKVKGSKRSRDNEESLSLCNPDQLFNEIIQEPITKKQKRVKKSEIVQQLEEFNDFENDFGESDFDKYDLNLTGNSQSNQCGQDKKKRVLTRNQRIAANLRERKRMNIMNESFVNLREALPINTGRKRRKMSRLDIVVGAMEYIAYLEELLEKDVPGEIDFEAYQNSLYLL